MAEERYKSPYIQKNINTTSQIYYTEQLPSCITKDDCKPVDATFLFKTLLEKYCIENDIDLTKINFDCLNQSYNGVNIPQDVNVQNFLSYVVLHLCNMYGELTDVKTLVNQIQHKLPVCKDDEWTMTQGNSITNYVTFNDVIISNYSVNIKTAPLNGVATVNNDNSITYVPSTGYSGNDVFVYELINELGDKCQATVKVRVLSNIQAVTCANLTSTFVASVNTTGGSINQVIINVTNTTNYQTNCALTTQYTVQILDNTSSVIYTDTFYGNNNPTPYAYTLPINYVSNFDTVSITQTVKSELCTTSQLCNDAVSSVVNLPIPNPVITNTLMDDSTVLDKGKSVIIDVLANDIILSGNTETKVITSTASGLTVPATNRLGKFIYTNNGLPGLDSFIYYVKDSLANIQYATSNITITNNSLAQITDLQVESSVAHVASNLSGNTFTSEVSSIIITPPNGETIDFTTSYVDIFDPLVSTFVTVPITSLYVKYQNTINGIYINSLSPVQFQFNIRTTSNKLFSFTETVIPILDTVQTVTSTVIGNTVISCCRFKMISTITSPSGQYQVSWDKELPSCTDTVVYDIQGGVGAVIVSAGSLPPFIEALNGTNVASKFKSGTVAGYTAGDDAVIYMVTRKGHYYSSSLVADNTVITDIHGNTSSCPTVEDTGFKFDSSVDMYSYFTGVCSPNPTLTTGVNPYFNGTFTIKANLNTTFPTLPTLTVKAGSTLLVKVYDSTGVVLQNTINGVLVGNTFTLNDSINTVNYAECKLVVEANIEWNEIYSTVPVKFKSSLLTPTLVGSYTPCVASSAHNQLILSNSPILDNN